jgi:hypothetical protein
MAETIKISALNEIPSGALDDNSVLPVVDSGVTYKLPVTKLKAFIGDSFATDAELSAQISSVNSAISGLTTTAISEGSNQYYTNTRVKNYIGGENVVSSSQQITNLGFYSGPTAIKNALPEGTISSSAQVNLASVTGNTTTNVSEGTNQYYTDVKVKTKLNVDGVISGSAQLTSSLDTRYILSGSITQTTWDTVSDKPFGIVSSSVQVLGNSGVWSGSAQLPLGIVSGSEQITDLGFATTSSISTTINVTVNSEYVKNRLPETTISSSQQITNFGFVSSSTAVPQGTISSSQQITDFGFISSSTDVKDRLPDGTVSSSAQVVIADATLTGFNTSLVSEVPSNLYFTGQRVIEMLTPLHIFSGSVNTFTSSVGGGGASIPDGTISSSQQITDFGYISSSVSVVNSLPDGTISSSAQITNLGFITDASVGTTITDTVTSTYIKNRLPENTVSASAQLTSTFAQLDGATGVLNLSSSLATRVTSLEGSSGLTPGLVSESAQVNYLGVQNQLTFEGASITVLQTGNKVELTGSAVSYSDVTNKPFGIISSSIQISAEGFVDTFAVDAAITSFSSSLTTTVNQIISDIDTIEGNYAWTGSNTFEGNQTIFGNLSVTGSITGDSFIVGGAGTPIIESATNLEISASADINIFSQNMIVSASVDIGDTLKLKSWNPLPAGELGMLAVSSSAAGVGGLYFYNGTVWQSVDLT